MCAVDIGLEFARIIDQVGPPSLSAQSMLGRYGMQGDHRRYSRVLAQQLTGVHTRGLDALRKVE